jgi:hypothetical protein
MLPSILALQRTRMPPLAGLRSVPKIPLAQGELFEDPGHIPGAGRSSRRSGAHSEPQDIVDKL